MKLAEWERSARWRALEVADGGGQWVSLERRIEATVQSCGGVTAGEVKAERLDGATRGFLRRRARWLDGKVEMGEWWRELRVPRLPSWWLWLGSLGAVGLGFAMAQVGNERELNLLALPLLGLLLWNWVVMLFGLVVEFWPVNREAEGEPVRAGFVGLLMKWSNRGGVAVPKGAEGVRVAFDELTGKVSWQRMRGQLRVWLHVAAALVAMGSIAAMFARGWSREYRVVWESTLLGEEGAKRFFGGLFGPASRVLGVRIPLDEVGGMRRGEGVVTKPGQALPWLQLYAGTMVLGVVVPRLLLAMIGLVRGRRVLRAEIERQGWPSYAIKLLRKVEGGDEKLLVLVQGELGEGRVTARWEGWLREVFGGRVRLEVERVPEGTEDDWLEAWQPEAGRVVLVFFLASTPEEEVQGQLVRRLREVLEQRHFEPEVTLLLDAVGLEQRWSADQCKTREQLWTSVVGGGVEKMLVGGEKGVSEVGNDLSRMRLREGSGLTFTLLLSLLIIPCPPC